MKCLTIMEQTYLISVCVFCLLCATHIHCSESAVKSKARAKGGEGGRSVVGVGGGSSEAASRGVQGGRSVESTESHVEFLGGGGGWSPEASGTGAGRRSPSPGDESVAHSVLSDSNGGVESSRNSIQSVNKYIKIPEGLRGEDGRRGRRSLRDAAPRGRTLKSRSRRSAESFAPVLDEQLYIENLFRKYRNSEDSIDLDGFKTMLRHLGLSRFAVLGDRNRNNNNNNNHHHHHHHHHHQDEEEAEDEDEDEGGDDEDEGINSLELRGSAPGGSRSNDTVLRSECMSPGNLLQTIVRENLALDNKSRVGVDGARSSSSSSSQQQQQDGRGGEDASSASLKSSDLYLSKMGLLKLCPFLIYHLVEPQTCHSAHLHEELEENDNLLAWLYATASVVIVSLCGLLGVFVIPIMGHAFYQQLLQFLVALAVGTLCGDALLHLLPHAMIPHSDEAHATGESHDHDHTSTMWKGLAVLLGIVFFFFTEKCLTLASEWRKKHQRNKNVQGHSHVQILNGSNESDTVGEKLCKHKYSSYPYCYPDIKSNKDGHEHQRRNDSSKHNSIDERDMKTILVPKWHSDAKDAGESQRLTTHVPEQEHREDEKQSAIDDSVRNAMVAKEEKMLDENEVCCGRKDGEYLVIIREHESIHHGHSHAHGHVHSPPESLSSVAWMVILGDGLHNFTDGMAIGAAFANNIAGGFSTAVAVFCHELPHELGDFAVLIKAGMTAKQAVFYNLISSILCFFGMCLGIFIGDNPQSTSWVFAVSAGMFLYIGLVDMFPELTSSHSAVESSFCQCSLQGLGVIAGVSIMLIIAFYEDQLLTLFN